MTRHFIRVLLRAGVLALLVVRPLPCLAQAPPEAGLQVWLDAGKEVDVDGLDDVQTWADQSGQHDDFMQTNRKERPEVSPDGMNGKPAIVFDGLTDSLTCVLKSPLSGSICGFVVWQAPAPQQSMLQGGYNNRLIDSALEPGSVTAYHFSMVPGLDLISINGQIVTDEPILSKLSSTVPSGSQIAAVAIGSQVRPNGNDLSGWNFTGLVSEVLIYSPTPADSDAQQVEQYLMTKYGIR